MRTCFPRYAALLVAVSAVAFGLAGACTTEEGSTPTCVEDLTDDDGGAVANRHLDGGCNPFAICLDDQGNAQAPEACCVDANKQPLTGTELQICLYGYGAANPPTTTSTSTSTSTTGGGGGAGGSGGGNGGAGGGTGGNRRAGGLTPEAPGGRPPWSAPASS